MSRHFLTSLFEPRSILFFIDAKVEIKISLSEKSDIKTVYVDYNTNLGFHIKENFFVDNLFDSRLDMSVICISSHLIPDALNFLSKFNPKSAIVLHCPAYDKCNNEIVNFCKKWAADNHCELLGPESSGIQRPHSSFNLSWHPNLAKSGKIALLSQSRSITSSLMDWAEDINIGFSLIASIGKKDALSISKILDYLIWDLHTETIVLYLEDVSGIARDFVSALRALARVKPVIVLKTGQDDSTSDLVFSAIMRRAGAVRVKYFIQLFSAVKALSYPNKIYGRNVILLSNGSGPPQLASNFMEKDYILLRASLSIETLQYLESFIDKNEITENTIIVYKPFTGDLISKVIKALINDKGVDGILVLLSPDFSLDSFSVTKQLADISSKTRKPVITCLMGDAEMRPLRRLLNNVGVFAFRTPESSAYAMGVLAEHYYNQQMLLQVQPSIPFHLLSCIEDGEKLIRKAMLKKNLFLDRKEIESLFRLFGVFFSNAVNSNQEIGPISIRVWSDATFGPVIYLYGGSSKDLCINSSIGIDVPPLNNFLANLLMERSGVYRNNTKPTIEKTVFANLQYILVQISELISEFSEIESLKLDSCFVGNKYLRVSDTELLLRSSIGSLSYKEINYPHMAIHPYPVKLVKTLYLKNGVSCTIRPIRPEDAEILQNFIRGLSDKSRYMRFISAMRELTPRMLAHYTQIDYHRELALVAIVNPDNEQLITTDSDLLLENMVGFVHYLYNEDGLGVEYALVVGDKWQRLGLGKKLMSYIINVARDRGLEYIEGYVLRNNKPMLGLLESLGFSSILDRDDKSMYRVKFNLK